MQGGEHDGVKIRFRELGAWWDGGEELDVVALDRGVAYCGECKYRTRSVPKSDVEALVRRAQKVQSATGAKALHLFMWARSGLDKAAAQVAGEHGVRTLRVADVVAGSSG